MNTLALTTREPVRIKHSLAWLALLAPIFFLSYGWANQLAASRGVTASIVFDWERVIPFLPWTILPYWSIDLMYGLSFLACRNPREVNHQGLRLLSAQLISVAFFVAFPLRFSADKPVTDGIFGALFDALAGSVLTTWQHHFFDVPSGLLVGLFALWLWPDQGESPLFNRQRISPAYRRLSLYCLLGASLCVLIATLSGWALWAIWPAASLTLVAFNYARGRCRLSKAARSTEHARALVDGTLPTGSLAQQSGLDPQAT